jgi:hypothetical protein
MPLARFTTFGGPHIAAGSFADQILLALLGWMGPKMIERYLHVRAQAKKKAVNVFDVVSAEADSRHFHHSHPMAATAISNKPFGMMVGSEGLEPPTSCL